LHTGEVLREESSPSSSPAPVRPDEIPPEVLDDLQGGAADAYSAPLTPEAFLPFRGTWTSNWADVTNEREFTISVEGSQARVRRASSNWRVSQVSFDGRVLSFRTEGGDSNWAFIYYLEPAGYGRLSLRVHRLHDNQSFTGEFTK
jgi:hypothetical protein